MAAPSGDSIRRNHGRLAGRTCRSVPPCALRSDMMEGRVGGSVLCITLLSVMGEPVVACRIDLQVRPAKAGPWFPRIESPLGAP